MSQLSHKSAVFQIVEQLPASGPGLRNAKPYVKAWLIKFT